MTTKQRLADAEAARGVSRRRQMTKIDACDATRAALRVYDKALAAERATARDYADDLRAVTKAGQLRVEASREAATDAYAAYRDARDKWDALREKS